MHIGLAERDSRAYVLPRDDNGVGAILLLDVILHTEALRDARELSSALPFVVLDDRAGGVPCLNPRRGLTLLSPVCRDPAIEV